MMGSGTSLRSCKRRVASMARARMLRVVSSLSVLRDGVDAVLVASTSWEVF